MPTLKRLISQFQLLARYHADVSLPGDPVRSTTAIKYEIPLLTGTSLVYISADRRPLAHHAVIDNLVEDMLAHVVIEPTSPSNFPLYLVSEIDNSFRSVNDYRRINKLCRQDRYPLPVLQELLMSICLQNSDFMTLDLVSGYWQVPLTEEWKKIKSLVHTFRTLCFQENATHIPTLL